MAKPLGYCVMEDCDEFTQFLVLRKGEGLPPLGILDYPRRQPPEPRAVFADSAQARAAIARTEHYRQAFGRTDGPNALPDRKLCRVVPVVFVDPELQEAGRG